MPEIESGAPVPKRSYRSVRGYVDVDEIVTELRNYAELCDKLYYSDPSDYNAGRADAATEAINRVLRSGKKE